MLEIARWGAFPEASTILLDGSGMVSKLREQRLTGLAIEMHIAGELEATTDDEIALLTDVDAAQADHCIRLEMLLAKLHDELGAGRFAVLKGPSWAHRVYGSPELRPFADLDLLVRGAAISEVVAAVEALGGARYRPELARGFDARFAKSVTLNFDGFEVDLHRTLFLGPFQTQVPVDALWRWTEEWTFLERTFLAHQPEMALVHAASDLALNRNTRLLNHRDVWELAGVADAGGVADAAAATILGAPTVAGLALVIDTFGDPDGRLELVRRRVKPSRTSKAMLRLHGRLRTARRQLVGAAIGTGRPDHAARVLWAGWSRSGERSERTRGTRTQPSDHGAVSHGETTRGS